MRIANKIIADFKPDVAVGVGGFASGPVLKAAVRKGVPAVLQEQNSYAGVTNKLLHRKLRGFVWPIRTWNGISRQIRLCLREIQSVKTSLIR